MVNHGGFSGGHRITRSRSDAARGAELQHSAGRCMWRGFLRLGPWGQAGGLSQASRAAWIESRMARLQIMVCVG